ncbi:putative 4-hydroxy-4-methyl-2-oxoglutarate aldolase 3 [Cinnamomum micranthum f. kanehirae]|uniref:4-hydroxy-4-methyl-2-oxoglutarate aldolase n=1 Tax=Cinnamomum micranthum f. kanehirae TaxID=337451 RepID=A0A3S3NCA4_9MAGN|nr:putative 4-hydroxy-4-methyl-2-oxoglutarate aldolase 3 [Cinnamomum micranthum f. kanehirae]
MAAFATADICDANERLLESGDLRILHPVFKIYGRSQAFFGPIVTIKVFEENLLVKELLEAGGEGRVLMIDGGGSMRRGMVGGYLAQLAKNMGWSGILVNGCVRDVEEINACDIGIRALASVPRRCNKNRIGEIHVPVHIGDALIRDGEWLYADSDGILISKTELSITPAKN